MSKPWLKLWKYEWLFGSVRVDLTGEERSIFIDLLALAGQSRREGYVEHSEGLPFDFQELSEIFKMPISVIASTVNKCVKSGSIHLIQTDNTETHTIFFTNYDKYQAVPEAKQRLDGRSVSLLERVNLRKLIAKNKTEAFLRPKCKSTSIIFYLKMALLPRRCHSRTISIQKWKKAMSCVFVHDVLKLDGNS